MSLKKSPVQVLKKRMEELNFFPKKFLGQNFLINSDLIKETVLAVHNLEPSFILEVGPGLGALTEEFILFKKPLLLAEMDRDLCIYWKNRGLNVLEGDVLKSSWASKLKEGAVLTGNLPYQVASRLMVECCPGPSQLKAAVLMFQKEVAQRIEASPGEKEYGLISVLSQSFWASEFLLEASPSDFYPKPKVAGRVLVFHKKKSSLSNTKDFVLFVKFCFSQRRKLLLSRLKKQEKDISVESIWEELNISSSIRAEELTPGQFISLFHLIEARRK